MIHKKKLRYFPNIVNIFGHSQLKYHQQQQLYIILSLLDSRLPPCWAVLSLQHSWKFFSALHFLLAQSWGALGRERPGRPFLALVPRCQWVSAPMCICVLWCSRREGARTRQTFICIRQTVLNRTFTRRKPISQGRTRLMGADIHWCSVSHYIITLLWKFSENSVYLHLPMSR